MSNLACTILVSLILSTASKAQESYSYDPLGQFFKCLQHLDGGYILNFSQTQTRFNCIVVRRRTIVGLYLHRMYYRDMRIMVIEEVIQMLIGFSEFYQPNTSQSCTLSEADSLLSLFEGDKRALEEPTCPGLQIR